LYWTLIMGLSAGPATTLNGHSLISLWTVGSVNLRPMSRLASAQYSLCQKLNKQNKKIKYAKQK